MKKVKISKRFFGVLTIDADVFDEIINYVNTYYDDCYVTIRPEHGTYGEAIEIGRAYPQICEDCQRIESVKITAHKGDNICTIYLNNKKKLHKSTFKIKARVDEDIELNTYFFINAIQEKFDQEKNSPLDRFVSSVFGGCMSIAFVSVIKHYDESLFAAGIFFETVLVIILLIALIISPLIKMIKNGGNWVRFKTESLSEQDQSQLNRRKKIYNLLSFAVSMFAIAISIYIIAS